MSRKFILSGILSSLLLCSGIQARETSPVKGTVSLDKEIVETLKSERVGFLKSMPEGLQKRQEEAIRAAINGDNGPLRAVRNARNTSPNYPEGIEVIELTKQKMRLYLPDKAHRKNKKLPLLIYLHGGGWVFGSLNSCADYCAMMAQRGIGVLAVDYPLAPENPFPAALDMCNNALEYAFKMAKAWEVDRKRVFVGGDSAGGNLAAVIALHRIMQGDKLPCGLVLYYPVTKGWDDTEAECWRKYGNGYGLDAGLMSVMMRAYTGTADIHQPLISPIEAPTDLLAKFPPVLQVGGTHDILYEQSKEFVDRLTEQGVDVETCFLPEACHLFITVNGQPTARKIAADVTERFIKERD